MTDNYDMDIALIHLTNNDWDLSVRKLVAIFFLYIFTVNGFDETFFG
jgi:hypothetical protein